MSWSEWIRINTLGAELKEIIYEKKYHQPLKGGIARLTVNRPEKYNALRPSTEEELFRCFYDASHDKSIGVVILTGAGDHFGAGGDVEWEAWGLRQRFYYEYPTNRLIRVCRKPIIAAVKGYCIGSANHIAYFCDFTIAAENAIFGQNGPRVASPADGYIVQYLVQVVGAKKARELWMLCRRYTADEALGMGLINKVVPLNRLDDEVDMWCEEILTGSPTCIEILKASFDSEWDSMPPLGIQSTSLYPDFFDSSECLEGSKAFLEKRKPKFWKARKRKKQA